MHRQKWSGIVSFSSLFVFLAMVQLNRKNFAKLAGAQQTLIDMPWRLNVICHARLSFHLLFKALGRPAEQWIQESGIIQWIFQDRTPDSHIVESLNKILGNADRKDIFFCSSFLLCIVRRWPSIIGLAAITLIWYSAIQWMQRRKRKSLIWP